VIWNENIVALIVLGVISCVAIAFLPTGGGKEVALALGSAVGGWLAKGAVDTIKKPF
jgi:hypothetical protein